MSVALERVTGLDAAQRNTDIISKHLRPPMPNVRVYRDADLEIANSTITAVGFNSERWDVGGFHSTSSNNQRLVVPITGLYAVGADIAWETNGTGVRTVRILVGSTVIVRDVRNPTSGNITEQSISTVWRFEAGDIVTVEVQQTSGGGLDVLSLPSATPEFWMVRLGSYANEGVA